MAKKKDLGEVIQIRYFADRDTPSKFQKILRKVFTEEKRSLLIDMVVAPEVGNDYLNNIVFSTQALKTKGYTVTFVLDPKNYETLKSSPNANLFKFEIGTVVSKKEITSMLENTQSVLEMPGITIDQNMISITEDSLSDLEQHLKDYIDKILGVHEVVVLNLCNLKKITNELVHLLIVNTIQYGKALSIEVLDSQTKKIQENPQALILNLKKINTESTTKKSISVPDFENEDTKQDQDQDLPLDAISVDSGEHFTEEDIDLPTNSQFLDFEIKVNTLEIRNISPQVFDKHFEEHLEKLSHCGNQVYIDIRDFKNINLDNIRRLMLAYLELAKKNKVLSFQMLPDQLPDWEKCLPKVEATEKKEEKKPEFTILGSRLEIKNVPPQMFTEQFAFYFQKLLSTGHDSIVVDISQMKEVSPRCIEILILNYLDTIGRGLTMLVRIRPEMEEMFKKSGRGRTLPLEILNPELSQKASYFAGGKIKGIDMSKIESAMKQDKLTQKVLDKKFESMHIESRGTLQNWEPTPVLATEVSKEYLGTERRIDKRYSGAGAEVLLARGSISKFAGRRYNVSNISKSGICFSCTTQLSRGEHVRLKIHIENSPGVEIAGVIVWSTPVASQALFKTGIKFSNLSHLAKVQIQEILTTLYRNQQRQE